MKLLLALCIFTSLATFCQNTDIPKSNKFSLGITFSPDYCYRTLTSDASSTWVANRRNSLEQPKIGYTAGLNLTFNVSKRISFESGVLFSDKGEKMNNYSLSTNQIFEQTDLIFPTKQNINYHYYYLDFPIKADYYVLSQRTKLFLSAGLSANVFLWQKNTSQLEYNDGSTTKNNSTNISNCARINLAVIAGIGFSYDFTEKLYLKIEPTYRHSIISIVDASIKSYLYSTGLNTGVFYKL